MAGTDLISRKEAQDAVRIAYDMCGADISTFYRTAVNAVKALPSAERVGHWIQISPAKIYECSECGKNVMTDDIECYKYCHGCGARMKGEQND